MKYFLVNYIFYKGLSRVPDYRNTEVCFDDIDPETTDAELKKMAAHEVDCRFIKCSEDFRIYGKFWDVTDVEEINY